MPVYQHVDDLLEDLKHALGDDLEHLADIGHELGAVVLRHTGEIRTTRLIHQGRECARERERDRDRETERERERGRGW